MRFVKLGVLLSCTVLAGCGEPLTKAQVVEKYRGNTVSKLTSEKRLDHLGPNNPSLGKRYIYHQTDGQAVYSKRTDKGYARREAGRWWAGDDKICYSMRVTRAEDPEGDSCAPAGTDAAWSTFERGDTQNLRRPVKRARGGNSDIGFGYDKVLALAGAALVVGGGLAKAADAVCGAGGCPASQAAPANGNSRATSSSGAKSSGAGQSANASGYKITETIKYMRNEQTVVARGRCNNGNSFNIRYHPDNSPKFFIYSTGGSSIDNVAKRFCS